MKTALIFLVAAILIIAGVYSYYLSIGGTPLEDLFNQAVGLDGEEEEGNGLPIVVSLIPYVAIIAILVGIGVFLHVKGKKQGKNPQDKVMGE
jgi:H+/Cl- antiporter ClcA